ncbi:MAG: hypothetical protein RR071_08760 [Lachnospiraceae bacterium]
MTENEKHQIIKKLVDTNGNKQTAALKIGCTRRHINRLIAGYRLSGKQFFVHGNHNPKPAKTIPDETKLLILNLYQTKMPYFWNYSKANSKDDYDALAEEIFELRELKNNSELERVPSDDRIKRIAELQDSIKSHPPTLTKYDENLVNRLLQKIAVFDNHFVVEFKSCVRVKVDW